ncbi:MAG: flagellar basal-body rod protein FlgG [Lachnospiraceae bacterium]
MVRSLWSAATGMIAQQTNIDTISNNLANVNTTGYKTEVANFKTLLYQTLQTQTTTANGDPKPVGAQVGLGVRNSSISSIFKQGSFRDSESDTDFAINGKGLFAVTGDDGETYYTRNGNFYLSTNDSGGLTLCTSDGYAVQDIRGRDITFNRNYTASNLTVGEDGEFYYPDGDNNPQPLGIQIGLFQFNNPTGLEKLGSSYYKATDASGDAINEARSTNLEKSTIVQGYLESSNVQVVDEMVNMIVAQRAYEMNSKAITTSDEMLQQANNLKR